jgi:hypothetical protein
MIRLEQPGFERWDSEVLVQPGGTVPLRAALNRIAPKLASLTIQTAPGAAVSVGGVSKGVVSAQGNLTISDLSPGRHELSITKDRHRPGTRLVDLSGGDNRTERIDLEREFAGPYSDGFFDLNQWQAPASWRIDARKLLVSGPAMGWLGSREYQNFKLDFQLQLANGRGAAWAIRAETPGDFYLFQLRGPSASQAPNTIVVHLYRQGRSAASTPPQPVPIDLGVKDDWLHITAVADGPMITHYVESGLRPAREPLVLHKLASNMLPRSYAFGGIGFGTLDSEEFRISDFIVHPQ